MSRRKRGAVGRPAEPIGRIEIVVFYASHLARGARAHAHTPIDRRAQTEFRAKCHTTHKGRAAPHVCFLYVVLHFARNSVCALYLSACARALVHRGPSVKIDFDTTYGLRGSSYGAAFAAGHLPESTLFGGENCKSSAF